MDDYLIVGLETDSNGSSRLSKFLQHTGCGLSSAHAEKTLEALGQTVLTESITPNVDAEKEIKKIISEAHGPNIKGEDVMITALGPTLLLPFFVQPSNFTRIRISKYGLGSVGFTSILLRSVNLLYSPQERIIDLLTPEEFENIEKVFEKYGSQIAGVVTEFPKQSSSAFL